MWRSMLHWLSAPVFDGDPDRTDTARLLNGFLLIALVAVIVYSLGTVVAGDGMDIGVWVGLGAFLVLAVVALVTLRQGYVQPVGLLVVLLLWSLCTYMVVRFGGIHDEIVPGYFLTIVVAGLILGGKGVVGVSLLSGAALGTAYYLEHIGRLDPSDIIPSQLRDLVVILALLGLMGFLVRYVVKRLLAMSAIMQQNADALSEANQALVAHRDAEVARRERLLERIAAALSVAQAMLSTIGSEVTEEQGAGMGRQRLLRQAVEAVADRFGFLYVAAFWIDPSTRMLTREAAVGVLDAGAGASVEGIVVEQVRVGDGLVGTVAVDGKPRLVSDVKDDLEADDGPNTAALDITAALPGCTLALPIFSAAAVQQAALAQAEVLGVLVVRSRESRSLTDVDRGMLQALLAQLSIAIDQAQAFDAMRADLRAAEQAYRDIRRADWQELLRAERGIGYVSTEQVTSLVDASRLDLISAAEDGAMSAEAQSVVRVPIELAGQEIAEVQAHLPADMGRWTEERMAMLETLSEQLSQAMERARLHRETQRRATRERVLREITDEMGRASDLSSLMRITVESLNRSLGGSHLYVRLLPGNAGKDHRAGTSHRVDTNQGADTNHPDDTNHRSDGQDHGEGDKSDV